MGNNYQSAVIVAKNAIKDYPYSKYKEQLEMLKKADCDFVQGYYYAEPMPIPQFRDFLKKFNGDEVWVFMIH